MTGGMNMGNKPKTRRQKDEIAKGKGYVDYEDQLAKEEAARAAAEEEEKLEYQRLNAIYQNMVNNDLIKTPEKGEMDKENINWGNIKCENFKLDNSYSDDIKNIIKKEYEENKKIEEKYNNVKSYTGFKIGHKKPMVIPEKVEKCLSGEEATVGGRNRKTKRNKNLCRGKSVKRPNKCKKVKGCKVAKGKKRTYCRKAHNKRRVTSKKR
jgi:hypothetical protein